MQTTVNPLRLRLHDGTQYAPRHDPTDPAKVAKLVASMTGGGWAGAPIVADVDGAQAITGCHRLTAARIAGIEEVPAVDAFDLAAACGVDLYDLIDTYGTLEDALPALCSEVPPYVAEAYGLDID